MKIVTIKTSIMLFQAILFVYQLVEVIYFDVHSWGEVIGIWILLIITLMLSFVKEQEDNSK